MKKNKNLKSFNTDKIFSERGFVTVSMIITAPFFFILFSVFLFSILLLNRKNQLDNICYQFVLESQKVLVDHNEKLLALNSLAKMLISKKRALNLIIATAPPAIKAKAFLKKKAVVLEQKALRSKQKMLFNRGGFLSRSKLFQLKTEINSRFKFFSRMGSKRWNPSFNIKWKPSQLEVAVDDIAPVYRRSGNHSKNQSHYVKWMIDIKSVLPKWLGRLISVQKKWAGHCESHPGKGGSKWYSEIGEGKPSQKPLFSVFF